LEIKQIFLLNFYGAIAVPAETGSFCYLFGKTSDKNGYFSHFLRTFFVTISTKIVTPAGSRSVAGSGHTDRWDYPRHSPAISRKKAPHE
jgi:hypothetical protein